MKKKYTYPFIIIILLLTTSTVSAQIPNEYYFIVPGTMSYRLDGSKNPSLSENLRRGKYYGADVGGAMTVYNSSQYKDFALFHDYNDPNYITDPDDVNNVPADRFMLNYRIAYPSRTHYDYDTASKEQLFPLIILMHGAGERGDCWASSCYGKDDPRMWNNDHNLHHGGNQHLKAINAAPSEKRHWPGFVVVPQNKNGYNKGSELSSYTARVIALVQTLIKKYPIDPNRVYIHGLSNGAQGLWMLLHSRPDLFAAAAPMSGYRTYDIFHGTEPVAMDTTMIHIPIWQFQGGEDVNPYPHNTEKYMNQLKELGGTPRYTLYPNLGHGVWNTAYAEPDFFSWFQQYSKLTIHAYNGISEICDVANMSVRLGISKGFDAYEWRMIKGNDTSRYEPTPDWPNEIIATEVASYQVRFARGSTWTPWSEPYTFTTKSPTRPEITADGSTALPGLDGRKEVNISTAEEGSYYEWYKDDVLYQEGPDMQKINVSASGSYTLIVKNAEQCNGDASEPVYVSTEPYEKIPKGPENLTAQSGSEESITLYWNDKSDNEIGFEIYRSLNGSDYTWVTTTGPDILMYSDTLLDEQTEYFYKIRAFNRNGASAVSNTVSEITSSDEIKPTAPPNLTFEHFAYTEYRLNEQQYEDNKADEYLEVHVDQAVLSWWSSSDNLKVDRYELYADEILVATTQDTTITVTDLNEGETYNFYVVAIDNGGNRSTESNTVTVTTVLEGLYFNLYAGGTWDIIRDYSNWTLHGRGASANFNISAKQEHYEESDDYFAFDFFGFIHLTTAGEYTFYTKSDDGSQLWIGSKKVVDNDSTRESSVEASGTLALDSGVYPITVKYFERSGTEELLVSYEGPGIDKQPIPDAVLKSGIPNEPTGPPAAPSNLQAKARPVDFTIDLSWNDQPENPKFEIYRAKGEGAFEIIHTTAAGITSFTDDKLAPDQLYHYKLKAANKQGASGFSAAASATTPPDTEAPTTPENLVLRSKTSTKLALSWDKSQDNVGVAKYIVTYEIADATSRTQAFTATTVQNGITIKGLEPQTTYTFTVAASDLSGNKSAESQPLTAETSSDDELSAEFIEFSYKIEDKQVVLKWTTASEKNNDYFSIERSLDSGNFVAIGKVNGSGTTHQNISYEFTDRDPYDLAYYRIKQVDLDQTYSYSKVLKIALGEEADELIIYPNPTTANNINIKGFFPVENSSVHIQIFDSMGKNFLALQTDPKNLIKGVNVETNNMLRPGVYILVVSDGMNRSQKLFIIQ